MGLVKHILLWAAASAILFGAASGFQAWREGRYASAARAEAQHKLDRFRPGDCLVVRAGRDGRGNGDLQPSDCSSQGLMLTVGLKALGSQSCPGPHYFAYQVDLDGRQVGALCLVENLREGHCYTESAAPPLHEEVACSSTMAEAESVKDARVVKAVEGSDDPSVCADTSPVAYPEPKRVYCLGSPVG